MFAFQKDTCSSVEDGGCPSGKWGNRAEDYCNVGVKCSDIESNDLGLTLSVLLRIVLGSTKDLVNSSCFSVLRFWKER